MAHEYEPHVASDSARATSSGIGLSEPRIRAAVAAFPAACHGRGDLVPSLRTSSKRSCTAGSSPAIACSAAIAAHESQEHSSARAAASSSGTNMRARAPTDASEYRRKIRDTRTTIGIR